MMTSQPNILLITCDQFRGDALGVAGHPVVETPHLDQLSHDGVRFSQAYTACPSCIAARAGILTGLTPQSHGRVGYQDDVRFDYPNTLPGELARAGYHTQGVGKMHFAPARNLCGFHNVVLHDGYLHAERKARRNYDLVDDYMPWLREREGADADLILHGMNCNSWVARPWQYAESTHPTTWATTMGLDFLRRRDPGKPFFLWLSYVRPHPPLDPPQVYFDQYIAQEFPAVPMGDWADRHSRATRVSGPGFMGERQLHRARAAYYALITQIDHQIGRLFEYLGEHEVMDNTLIMFTSDHGELLGDHNLFGKALPYDGSARVPMLIRPPRKMPCRRGSIIDEPVELCDVMPTILDACGVDIPQTVEGGSLMPFTRGEEPAWRSFIHGEHAYGDMSNHYITDGKRKYLWFSHDGREQFFDIESDPRELHNLIEDAERQGEIAKMRARLITELVDREEGYVEGGRLVAGRTPSAIRRELAPLAMRR